MGVSGSAVRPRVKPALIVGERPAWETRGLRRTSPAAASRSTATVAVPRPGVAGAADQAGRRVSPMAGNSGSSRIVARRRHRPGHAARAAQRPTRRAWAGAPPRWRRGAAAAAGPRRRSPHSAAPRRQALAGQVGSDRGDRCPRRGSGAPAPSVRWPAGPFGGRGPASRASLPWRSEVAAPDGARWRSGTGRRPRRRRLLKEVRARGLIPALRRADRLAEDYFPPPSRILPILACQLVLTEVTVNIVGLNPATGVQHARRRGAQVAAMFRFSISPRMRGSFQ